MGGILFVKYNSSLLKTYPTFLIFKFDCCCWVFYSLTPLNTFLSFDVCFKGIFSILSCDTVDDANLGDFISTIILSLWYCKSCNDSPSCEGDDDDDF